MIKLETLPERFIGTGEVKGFEFNKVTETDKGFIYSVKNADAVYYEVFRKKHVPICLDFEKKIYSETDFKCIYPKSKDFGIWAWNVSDYNSAIERLNRL